MNPYRVVSAFGAATAAANTAIAAAARTRRRRCGSTGARGGTGWVDVGMGTLLGLAEKRIPRAARRGPAAGYAALGGCQRSRAIWSTPWSARGRLGVVQPRRGGRAATTRQPAARR